MKRAILTAILLVGTGCAPGLGKTLSLNSIPNPDPSHIVDDVAGARVVPLVDSREKTAIAEIEGRTVEPGGDVGNTVRTALESYLRSAGVVPRAFDVPTVGGSVERWVVNVTPGFPLTEIQAVASVKIEVNDRSGHPVFRRSYSGESNSKEPIVDEEKIAAVLGEAMGSALEEVAQDRNMVGSLR